MFFLKNVVSEKKCHSITYRKNVRSMGIGNIVVEKMTVEKTVAGKKSRHQYGKGNAAQIKKF